ncbi:Glycosyl hydrolases family 38 N-terminal domain-containing protein [Chitinophaga costaii]|uniref:Glycosyl hydrolases family 38 N-terminal domain-containing protein n=1 Tax=Chitinophaga costaii TaxID=1335309 RepID=A0A1C3ZLT1_9BACT|nr:glycoside hydrolase family 38 C-terminal domain-containing protein [Chitinophaga costaii]PUZ30426.1 glycoside hydrolase [Chitinophaga costaii]SCB83271.1 Glycosyl hydrolases family 38 N-terminal domain-containing protein [Chitinophaga costaii]
MKINIFIGLAGCVLGGIPALAQQVFTGISLKATPAYLRYHDQPARMARLEFHGGNAYAPGVVYISFNGLEDSVQILPGQEGLRYYELPLPGAPVEVETQASVKYMTNGNAYTARVLVPPARQWSVYLLPHAHVDVGYTNVQDKVLAIHMNNIDEAIKIAERTQDYPLEARFKWNTEAIWVVDNYLAKASPAKKAAFWEAVKKGWINLDGSYGNVNTSATSPVQLLHQFQTSLQLAKENGVEIHTMFQGDVPGASWGLSAQSDITGIHYFLSAPNASDRIGEADKLRDKPFYWVSPSGKQRMLFWQSSPYSIGYMLKGDKIPNFFTVENPTPFYTGKPSENFLNPWLFGYLEDLRQKGFPYNMTLLTWAMSDNAPIDPELPEAVKAWNERYTSPRLVITSTHQFFQDVEAAYHDKIPTVAGDYTEYWTDGISSGAKETAITRNASDALQQAGAIWALRGRNDYPASDFNKAWIDMVMFNEHTWGAYNSVSEPADPKVKAQWAYKQNFALQAQTRSSALLTASIAGDNALPNAVDVYNTLAYTRTALVTVPAALSQGGNLVTDNHGHKLPSQRLSSGELVFLVTQQAPFSKQRYHISPGKAFVKNRATVNGYTLKNDFYTVQVDAHTGNISSLQKAGSAANLADAGGLNQYDYLVGDSVGGLKTAHDVRIRVKENGPLLVSLLVSAQADGTHQLTREVQLVAGVDRVAFINTIDKKATGDKESLHFVFPFHLPGAQVRYNIPWSSITAESDQLPFSNRNWYTLQRWVDVSDKDHGITWSSPDAPLFEIGQYPTAGLLGGLHNSPLWRTYTDQQPIIASWVMNNLWHTNFRYSQEGPVIFHYYLHAHAAYNAAEVNETGLENHQPLVVAAATGAGAESLFFQLQSGNAYVENINPASDGNGVVLQLVNAAESPTQVTFTARNKAVLHLWECDLLESNKKELGTRFHIPAKGVLMVRVGKQ